MDSKEYVLLEPRARRVQPQMYLAGIAIKGTEHDPNPTIVVYSPNPSILRELVASHNELIRIKAEKEKVQTS